MAERLADLDDFLTAHPDSLLPVTRTILESGRRFTAADAFRAQHRLQELKAWTDRLFETVDVLALPTIGTTYTHAEIAADPIGRNLDLGRYTQFANLLDLAAVTVPNGFTADGRPASLTLFGPAFSDDTLALLAASLERPGDLMTIAVVGLHLSGEPRNHELTERSATLTGVARTAPCYRLYHLPSRRAGPGPRRRRRGHRGGAVATAGRDDRQPAGRHPGAAVAGPDHLGRRHRGDRIPLRGVRRRRRRGHHRQRRLAELPHSKEDA